MQSGSRRAVEGMEGGWEGGGIAAGQFDLSEGAWNELSSRDTNTNETREEIA